MIDRWLPPAASDHAAALDQVLRSVHVHIGVILVAWTILFVIALVRFRQGANPEPRAHGVRGVWPALAIGAVIVGDVFILATQALPAWSGRMAAPPAPSFEVRITAEQFAWNIHYPGPDGAFGRTAATLISASNPAGIDRADAAARDDIGLLNVLTLPLDRTVVVHLSSRDVIHSFTLNEMRVKQDAVPGTTARVWFTPRVAGQWEIACSQLCGMGHYRMRGEYRVLAPADFDLWQADELRRLR